MQFSIWGNPPVCDFYLSADSHGPGRGDGEINRRCRAGGCFCIMLVWTMFADRRVRWMVADQLMRLRVSVVLVILLLSVACGAPSILGGGEDSPSIEEPVYSTTADSISVSYAYTSEMVTVIYHCTVVCWTISW